MEESYRHLLEIFMRLSHFGLISCEKKKGKVRAELEQNQLKVRAELWWS